MDLLFHAILTLKNVEECYTFFEDVCTVNELLSLSQRYEVAMMLREGNTYLEIAEKTGKSLSTVKRYIAQLKKDKKIERTGPMTYGGYWKIVKEE